MSVQPDLVLLACPVCEDPTVKLDHVRKCVDRLKLERRGFQIMARNMFGMTPASSWQEKMDQGRYWRASGEAQCQICRQFYALHPELPGLPTLHLLCSGEIVKT